MTSASLCCRFGVFERLFLLDFASKGRCQLVFKGLLLFQYSQGKKPRKNQQLQYHTCTQWYAPLLNALYVRKAGLCIVAIPVMQYIHTDPAPMPTGVNVWALRQFMCPFMTKYVNCRSAHKLTPTPQTRKGLASRPLLEGS